MEEFLSMRYIDINHFGRTYGVMFIVIENYTVTRVQILDEAFPIMKGMHPTILLPVMDKEKCRPLSIYIYIVKG